MTTGPPTISARNTVRRDQSISPSERSNTRSDEVSSDGIARVVTGLPSLHQVLEDGLQVVVGRGDFLHLARFA